MRDNNFLRILKLNYLTLARKSNEYRIDKKIKKNEKRMNKAGSLQTFTPVPVSIYGKNATKQDKLKNFFWGVFPYLVSILGLLPFLSSFAFSTRDFIIKLSQEGAIGPNNYKLLIDFLGSTLFLLIVLLLFLTITEYISLMFSNKNLEFFLFLPIKHSTIYYSNIVRIYLDVLIVSFIAIAPILITAGVTLKMSFLYYFVMLLGILIIPLMTLAFICLISVPVVYLLSKIKRKETVGIIFTILVVGGIWFYMTYFGNSAFRPANKPNLSLEENERILNQQLRANAFKAKLVYPVIWILRIMFWTNSPAKAIIYLVLTILATLGIIVLISKTYYNSLSNFSISSKVEKKTKSIIKSKQDKTIGLIPALIRRDFKMIIREPNTVVSIIVSLVMPIVLFISMFYQNLSGANPTRNTASAFDFGFFSFAFLTYLTSFAFAFNNVANIAISREGTFISYIKTLPLKIEDFLKSKIYISMIFTIPIMLLATVMFSVIRGVPFWAKIGAIANSILIAFACILINIFFDCLKPNFEWEKINKINSQLKRNIPTLINVFVSLIYFGFGIFLATARLGKYAYLLFLIASMTVNLIYFFVSYYLLKAKGLTKLKETLYRD